MSSLHITDHHGPDLELAHEAAAVSRVSRRSWCPWWIFVRGLGYGLPMLGTVGMVVAWGLLEAGGPAPRIPEEGFVVQTGVDRVPTATELIVETLKMDQAIRTLERQTRQFEADQRCRRTPEECPPLIENQVRPQPEPDSGGGVIIIEGAPPGSAPSDSSSPPMQ